MSSVEEFSDDERERLHSESDESMAKALAADEAMGDVQSDQTVCDRCDTKIGDDRGAAVSAVSVLLFECHFMCTCRPANQALNPMGGFPSDRED